MKTTNTLLFMHSTCISVNLRKVSSKAKEKILDESTQVPNGGIIIVFSFGKTNYVKITDGVKTIAQLDKLGTNAESGSITWDDVSMLPEPGKIPVFSPQGLLSTGTPLFPENAVPLVLLDIRLPNPPSSGTFVLKSINGVASWVQE